MYIQLVSIHGLVRGQNVEMGRDADTGGQIRYVLELATTLARHPDVKQVDLFTRRIRDRRYSSDYGQEIEHLADNCRIVRLPCGSGRYMRKERLWPYLDDFIDGMTSFTNREGRPPTIVHGHYADAGYVAHAVASLFGVPFVFTGHSLGKPKLEYLLSEGWTLKQANDELAIEHRIAVEQECLAAADLVITSTHHEKEQQYHDYHKPDELRFSIIPPGTDLERFFPYYEYEMPNAEIDDHFKQARMRLKADLGRFHIAMEKPLILALCRPDRRKNIGALLDAYGKSSELQAIANLAIFAGIRQDIETMSDNERQVLTDMLFAMDRYNLYGKLAIPKHHDSQYEVPELYRLAAASRGVFVNTAFIELFGLTAIESSATGLPFVATDNGGTQDIAKNCESGILVDVNDSQAITQAILKLVTDRETWDEYSSNGINRVRECYTWETHVQKYVEDVKQLADQSRPHPQPTQPQLKAPPIGRRLNRLDSLLIADIDNTLLGDDDACRALLELMEANQDHIGLGVATGRCPTLVREAFEMAGIDKVDIVVASVGTEIYYGHEWVPDKGWAWHLREKWKPAQVHRALEDLSFLKLQEREGSQREFKISYDLVGGIDPAEAEPLIHKALDEAKLAYSLITSHGTFVDVLPHRASKGKAVRYLAKKWNIPIERIATAGDSGNDRDMLLGKTAGIVVANHDEELATLRGARSDRIYFADSRHAAGILEGLAHYRLLPADASQGTIVAAQS